MTRTLTGTVGVWLVAAVAVVAADFWEETAFTAWSDKEVEKMLTDSPWAKQQRIVLGTLSETPTQRQPLPRPGASLGGPRAATVVLAGGAQFNRIRRVRVTVTWASALPIKQARLRQAIGRDAPVPPQARAALTQQDPLYAVTVSGLPPGFRELARMEDAIKAATSSSERTASRLSSRTSISSRTRETTRSLSCSSFRRPMPSRSTTRKSSW